MGKLSPFTFWCQIVQRIIKNMLLKVLVVYTRKQNIQCKSIGAKFYRLDILISIMRCYCGCGCNLHTHFGTKTSFLGHCIAEIWHKLLLEITANCTIIKFVHKIGRKFPCTSTTKCVNISVSTQPFFTKQGPFYSQLDNQSYDHTIMELSDDIKLARNHYLMSPECVRRLGCFKGEVAKRIFQLA